MTCGPLLTLKYSVEPLMTISPDAGLVEMTQLCGTVSLVYLFLNLLRGLL